MSDVGKVTAARASAPATAPSAAQARIIGAALELFATHGVGGTSLQMIADSIGVTKAAVYHQFNSKADIVLAAAEAELARLEEVMDAAEADPSRRRDALVTGMVELAVVHRRTSSTILNDPVIVGYFAKQRTVPTGDGSTLPDSHGRRHRSSGAGLYGDAHRRHQRGRHAPPGGRT